MTYLISTCRTGHRMYRLHKTENIRWYYFISNFLSAVETWVVVIWILLVERFFDGRLVTCERENASNASSLSPPFSFLDFLVRPFLSEVSLLEWWVKWFQVLDILPSWQVAFIALKETTSLHFRWVQKQNNYCHWSDWRDMKLEIVPNACELESSPATYFESKLR